MKKRNETIRMLVLSAMFAALCCVTTMLVQFPTVAGYTNIGEGMCLLAGLVLGPWYGFFAAGIGSGLADLLAGYAHYVPGTFIIKGLVLQGADPRQGPCRSCVHPQQSGAGRRRHRSVGRTLHRAFQAPRTS